MAGLRTLQQERLDAVKAIREHADILEKTRDPERAADAGRKIAREAANAAGSVAIIDRESGAWAELDRMNGQGGC